MRVPSRRGPWYEEIEHLVSVTVGDVTTRVDTRSELETTLDPWIASATVTDARGKRIETLRESPTTPASTRGPGSWPAAEPAC